MALRGMLGTLGTLQTGGSRSLLTDFWMTPPLTLPLRGLPATHLFEALGVLAEPLIPAAR